jgi:pantoate--beta-alanine ligase
MNTVTSIQQLRQSIAQYRAAGDTIAFVPTMGNLHAGHIKLVTEAKKKADKVVVSIFVNPTQFGEGEDLDSYPRTETDDKEKLKAAASDLLFLPSINEMYQKEANTLVSVNGLSLLHCGSSRPAHFDGVTTIVAKLFNSVQPDFAFFGEKDFQQLTIVRRMVKDLNIPVEIIGIKTQRETDGLALSSRNHYLSKNERLIAPELYQSLCKARDDILSKEQSMRTIEKQQSHTLNLLGFTVDYFSICRSDNLVQAEEGDNELVVLVAAKLGKPRLIDNICFSTVPI